MICLVKFDVNVVWLATLQEYVAGQIVLLTGSLILEMCAVWACTRGGILDADSRTAVGYIVYVRLGLLFLFCTFKI